MNEQFEDDKDRLTASSRRRLRSWLRFWPVLTIAATLAYFFWTNVCGFASVPTLAGRQTDPFNLLVHGFLKGHLYLDCEVPKELIAASNPYDPALRPDVPVMHDASYFSGRYYIYFGPGPVLTLLLPFSVICQQDLPLPYAVGVFTAAGYLVLVAIFAFLQRRFYPAASGGVRFASLVALGGGTLLIALLRRPHIWELPAASGFFFFAVALGCLLRALFARRPVAWAAAGGLALGLAVACRPTYLVSSLLFALPPAWALARRFIARSKPQAGSGDETLTRSATSAVGGGDGKLARAAAGAAGGGYDWRAVAAAAAACTSIVVGLLIYNYARFGAPFEFGQKYQLAGFGEEAKMRHFSAAYVGYNLYSYFLAPLHWTRSFPFVDGVVLGKPPAGHAGWEYAFGILPSLPFVWWIIGLAFPGSTHDGRGDQPGKRFALGAIAAAAALQAAFLLFFFGTCIRYMVEFTPWLMLLAACGLMEIETRWTGVPAGRASRWPRRIPGLAGIITAFTTTLIAALAVANLYNLEPNPPPAYRPLAKALTWPMRWIDQRRYPGYGAREITFTLPRDRTPRDEPLVAVAQSAAQSGVIFVRYVDPEHVRFGYDQKRGLTAPCLSHVEPAPPGHTHVLRFSIGGTPGRFDGLHGTLRGECDGTPLWYERIVTPDVFPGALTTGADPSGHAHGPRFTGQITTMKAIADAELEHLPTGWIRAWVLPSPALADRPLPLASNGRHGAGDVLFLRMGEQGTVVFGYDHWSKPVVYSTPRDFALGEQHVIDFTLPIMAAGDAEPVLRVKLDGKEIWRERVRFYPSPTQVYAGRNVIFATTAEPVFEQATFEPAEAK